MWRGLFLPFIQLGMAEDGRLFVRKIKLPPLPPIPSEEIRSQVFTHRSVHARPTHLFEDAEGDPSPDNEKLEHVGDSVLGLCTTRIIRSMYPRLRVGPATKIRSRVVDNSTLACLTVAYSLHKDLRLHPAQALTLRASPKIRADIFESYVGGLYVASGFDAVEVWLSALLRPYIQAAYNEVRTEYGLPPIMSGNTQDSTPSSPECESTSLNTALVALTISDTSLSPPSDIILIPSSPSPSPTPTPPPSLPSLPPSPFPAFSSGTPPLSGHLSLFNQLVQQKRMNVQWVWEDSKLQSSTSSSLLRGENPTWIAKVVRNSDGFCLGVGTGRTKKVAKNEAAEKALVVLGIDI